MIFFIGLALVPFDPTNHTSILIHNSLGMTSAFLFVIGFFIMARRAKDRIVYRGTMMMLMVSLVLFFGFVFSPKQSNFIFAFEAGSWLATQLWVFWITFYIHKNPLLR